MKSWMARLLMMLTIVAMIVAFSVPAVASHDDNEGLGDLAGLIDGDNDDGDEEGHEEGDEEGFEKLSAGDWTCWVYGEWDRDEDGDIDEFDAEWIICIHDDGRIWGPFPL